MLFFTDEPTAPSLVIRIHPAAKRVFVGAKALRLTPIEFSLLELFLSQPDRVFSRAEILELIWNTQHLGYARNVDCHVTRLRRKLEQAGLAPAPIRTVLGTGYGFGED